MSMKTVASLDRKIEDLQEQKRKLMEDIQNKSEELVKKLRGEVDIDEIGELNNIKFDVFNWYYAGRDPIKRLKAKCKELLEIKSKEIEILNKLLKTLDKL